MNEEKTIIGISLKVRDILEGMKQRNPGGKGGKAKETYDDVLRKILKIE